LMKALLTAAHVHMKPDGNFHRGSSFTILF
jgi:hypothetical protein